MATRVGVLAIQGDVEAHGRSLRAIGCEPVPVLWDRDLDSIEALILPGGESTTISKGIARQGLHEALERYASSGRPVLGTCAGAILLAARVEARSSDEAVYSFAVLDITARRNAYGTQVDSFAAEADPGGLEELAGLRCVFIRAPELCDLGSGVETLLRVEGRPVLVRQGPVLAASFHPELTEDTRIHRLLLSAGLA